MNTRDENSSGTGNRPKMIRPAVRGIKILDIFIFIYHILLLHAFYKNIHLLKTTQMLKVQFKC